MVQLNLQMQTSLCQEGQACAVAMSRWLAAYSSSQPVPMGLQRGLPASRGESCMWAPRRWATGETTWRCGTLGMHRIAFLQLRQGERNADWAVASRAGVRLWLSWAARCGTATLAPQSAWRMQLVLRSCGMQLCAECARGLHSWSCLCCLHFHTQVVPALRNGMYDDWELVEGIWDHVFRCTPVFPCEGGPGPMLMHAHFMACQASQHPSLLSPIKACQRASWQAIVL